MEIEAYLLLLLKLFESVCGGGGGRGGSTGF